MNLLDGGFLAAPMAGVSDSPYRQLAHQHGASLTFTEMVSAKALSYKNERTADYLDVEPIEGPVGVQIFGSDTQILAQEAAQLCEMVRSDGSPRFCLVDINMGCPAPKIYNNQDGSALLNDIPHAEEIISAVVEACGTAQHPLPVSVKTRIGLTSEGFEGLELAKAAERAGAAFVTIHGRSVKQGYSGEADWEKIARIAEALTIPVVGNGDIKSAAEARERMRQSGCKAVMIGRASHGNPWVFEDNPQPTQEEIVQTAIWHLEELSRLKSEKCALLEMRTHSVQYAKVFAAYYGPVPNFSKFKTALATADSKEKYQELFQSLIV